MATRLILREKEQDGDLCGRVLPLVVTKDGETHLGLSVGHWGKSDNGTIYIDLYSNVDTIIHEVATRKSVRAEIRAAEKDAKGEEHPFHVEFDPVTKRFKQVEE